MFNFSRQSEQRVTARQFSHLCFRLHYYHNKLVIRKNNGPGEATIRNN